MKMVSMMVPDTLVAYIEIQKDWVTKKQTGAIEMNFFQGGVSNMNLKHSVKLTAQATVSATPSIQEMKLRGFLAEALRPGVAALDTSDAKPPTRRQ